MGDAGPHVGRLVWWDHTVPTDAPNSEPDECLDDVETEEGAQSGAVRFAALLQHLGE